MNSQNQHLNHPELPRKPSISDYGYWEWHTAVPCSRDQLIRECSQMRIPDVCLVWTPEFETFVPAAQVPFLQEALKRKLYRSLFLGFGAGICSLLFGILLAYLFVDHVTDLLLGKHVILLLYMIIFGIGPIVYSINKIIHFEKSLRINNEAIFFQASTERLAVRKRFSETLVYCSVIVFLGLLQFPFGLGNTIERGGLMRAAVVSGEYWRMLTCAFLHGGLVHLFMNSWVLLSLGRFLELLCGRSYLAIVYCLSILGSSLASALILGDKLSIGASGGIMGLFGFIAVLGFRMKAYLPPNFMKNIGVNIAAIAVIGLAGYHFIDNAAHAGGLITGAILGLILIPEGQRGFPLQQTKTLIRLGIISDVILLSGACITLLLIITR